jgi:hypothetical protein
LEEQFHGKVQNRPSLLHPQWKLNLWHALRPQFMVYGCETIAKLLKIYCDNSAAVFFSKNDRYSNGAKHMELKYFAVKEEVQKQRVAIEHITTTLMIADPLTKGLPPKTFKEQVNKMGLACNPLCP